MQIKRFADAYSVCREQLISRGISVDLVQDGEAIQDILLAVGKPYLTPHLSPLENSFTEANSFWLVGSKDDQVVCAGGVRFDDIGTEPISRFWTREVARYYKQKDPQPQLIVDPAIDNLLPGGRIAYMGDLISVPKTMHVSELQSFARSAQMLSCMMWAPDVTCAFLKERHAKLNAGMHYGYLSSALNIHSWVNPPFPRSNAEYFVYSTSGQLKLLASHIIREAADSNTSRQEVVAEDPVPKAVGGRNGR